MKVKKKMSDNCIPDYSDTKSDKERVLLCLELGVTLIAEKRRFSFVKAAKLRAKQNGDVEMKWKKYLWDDERVELAQIITFIDDYLNPMIKKIQNDEVKIL